MARLQATAAWFFACLGIVLLGASIVVVPGTAFADGDGDCATKCNGEPMCMQSCCGQGCDFDPACVSACMAPTPACARSPNCDVPLDRCDTKRYPCPGTITNCKNGTPKNRCDGCLCTELPIPNDDKCYCQLAP